MNISKAIVEMAISKEGGKDTIGGDIIRITDLLEELLYVHESKSEEENDYTENSVLTTNVLNTTNHLFSSTIGWEEISENITRYESSSNLLRTSESAGYLLFQLSSFPNYTGTGGCWNCVEYVFEGSELQMNASVSPSNSSIDGICYNFDNSEICLPRSSFENIVRKTLIKVAVQYNIDPETYIFPTTTLPTNAVSYHYLYDESSENNMILNGYIIGLSLNNGTTDIEITPEDPVIITFQHELTQVDVLTLL